MSDNLEDASEAEPIAVDWSQHPEPADSGQPGTLGEAVMPLMALGAVQQSTLAELHARGFAFDAPATEILIDTWAEIFRSLSPADITTVASLNHFFYQLVVDRLAIPLGDVSNPTIVHVYNSRQLTAAIQLKSANSIAVHAGIPSADIADAAASTLQTLLLGPGVTVTDVGGGTLEVYSGAQVIGVSNGRVTVRRGSTATNVTGGNLFAWGGAVTNINGGHVNVYKDGLVEGVNRGIVHIYHGGKAKNITGGDMQVHLGGEIENVSGGSVYLYGVTRLPRSIDVTGAARIYIYNTSYKEWVRAN